MIELKNTSKKFGNHVALDNISLTIDSEILLDIVKTISSKGCSVLYVSHRIEEMINSSFISW